MLTQLHAPYIHLLRREEDPAIITLLVQLNEGENLVLGQHSDFSRAYIVEGTGTTSKSCPEKHIIPFPDPGPLNPGQSFIITIKKGGKTRKGVAKYSKADTKPFT